ncbi:MAG: hypothetical protein HON23_05110 [Rickettsiales bacterium]|jgi:ankyrin repeat protein|nr:hypothetical protein [Rickettsiales bacterium]
MRATQSQSQESLRRELIRAVERGDLEGVERLLDRGADVNKARITDGSTPLSIAASNGHTELVQLLLDRRADVNKATKGGVTPLVYAAFNGHAEVAKLLLDRGADVNQASTTDGKTPLNVAASNDVVRLLKNHIAFQKAIAKGSLGGVKDFIRNGFNIRAVDINHAIQHGKSKTALYLIKQVDDTAILNGTSEVPLVEASKRDNQAVVKALLDKGGDPEQKDANARSALDIARIDDNEGLKTLLSKAQKKAPARSYRRAVAAEESVRPTPSAPPLEEEGSGSKKSSERAQGVPGGQRVSRQAEDIPLAVAVAAVSEGEAVAAVVVEAHEMNQSHVTRLNAQSHPQGCCSIM